MNSGPDQGATAIEDWNINQMNFNSLRGEAIRLDPQVLARKAYVVGTLELLCQTLELTDAQLAEAERRYLGVGEWLAGADSPLLRTLSIYLQGSTAIGTTVKPIASNEHDVDLVANLRAQTTYPPGLVKHAIGERLRQHGSYSRICWRKSRGAGGSPTPTNSTSTSRPRSRTRPVPTAGNSFPTRPSGTGRPATRKATAPCSRGALPWSHASVPGPCPISAQPTNARTSSPIRRDRPSKASCAARCRSESGTVTCICQRQERPRADLRHHHHAGVAELRVLRHELRLRHRA